MKTCKICKVEKAITEFSSAGKYKDKQYTKNTCKPCTAEFVCAYYRANSEKKKEINAKMYRLHGPYIREVAKRYRGINKSKILAARRKSNTGWTAEQFESAWLAQEGKCAICHIQMQKTGSRQKDVVHADHNHTTGQLRALLCALCNSGLGFFKDDPIILQAAVDYLKKYASTSEPVEASRLTTYL